MIKMEWQRNVGWYNELKLKWWWMDVDDDDMDKNDDTLFPI